MTFQELVDSIHIPKPTLHNVLKTMCEAGLIQKSPCKPIIYSLGPLIDDLAKARTAQHIRTIADNAMRQARTLLKATTSSLTVFQDDAFYTVRRLTESNQFEDLQTWMSHPYANASSLVLAAFLPPQDLQRLKTRLPFAKYGVEAWQHEDDYSTALERTRTSGYALIGNPKDTAEPLDLALPIFSHDNTLVACITFRWNMLPTEFNLNDTLNAIRKWLNP